MIESADNERPRSSCPSAAVLAGLMAGEIDPDERDRLNDHLIDCAACADEIRALESVGEVLESVSRRVRLGVPRTMLRAAAALLIVAGVGWWAALSLPSTRPVVRGGAGAVQAGTPLDGAVLAEKPTRLAIALEGNAASYRFELFDAQLEVLWTSPPQATPSVLLPREVRARLQPGQRYGWRVEVDDGLLRRQLPAREFSIAP